jgi:hypothetical protein
VKHLSRLRWALPLAIVAATFAAGTVAAWTPNVVRSCNPDGSTRFVITLHADRQPAEYQVRPVITTWTPYTNGQVVVVNRAGDIQIAQRQAKAHDRGYELLQVDAFALDCQPEATPTPTPTPTPKPTPPPTQPPSPHPSHSPRATPPPPPTTTPYPRVTLPPTATEVVVPTIIDEELTKIVFGLLVLIGIIASALWAYRRVGR